MATITTTALALGHIFEYPYEVEVSELEEWVRDTDFNTNQIPEAIGIDASGQQIENAPTMLGQVDGIGMLFNPSADLRYYGDCSFVTIKDENGARKDRISSISEELRSHLDSIGVADSLHMLEVTIEGSIRTDNGNSLSRLCQSESLEKIGGIHGSDGEIGAIRLSSGDIDDQNNFYKCLIDKEAKNNPRRWQFTYARRFKPVGDYSYSGILDDLEKIINLTD